MREENEEKSFNPLRFGILAAALVAFVVTSLLYFNSYRETKAVEAEERAAVQEELSKLKKDKSDLQTKLEEMEKTSKDNSEKLVEDRKTAENGEMVIALIDGDEATLKKFYRERSGNIRLQPANPEMKPMTFPSDRVTIQGIVIGILRKY